MSLISLIYQIYGLRVEPKLGYLKLLLFLFEMKLENIRHCDKYWIITNLRSAKEFIGLLSKLTVKIIPI